MKKQKVMIKNPTREKFIRVVIDNNVAVIKLDGDNMLSIHFESPSGGKSSLKKFELRDQTETVLRVLAERGIVYVEEEESKVVKGEFGGEGVDNGVK